MTQVEVKGNDKPEQRKVNAVLDTTDHKEKAQPVKKNLVYVHEPGTVHLNAFEGAAAEARAKRDAAESEYQSALVALEDKRASSQFVEE